MLIKPSLGEEIGRGKSGFYCSLIVELFSFIKELCNLLFTVINVNGGRYLIGGTFILYSSM